MNNTLNRTVRSLQSFLKREVADHVFFKVPDDRHADQSYQIQVASPQVNLFQSTAREVTRPGHTPMAAAPQIVIQVLDIEDKPIEQARDLTIQLTCILWNPGTHGNEFMIPEKEDSLTGRVFHPNDEPNVFSQSYNGWQDLYTLSDMILTALQSQPGDLIDQGVRVLVEDGITAGPYRTESGPIDSHPYYLGWIRFSIRSSIIRNLFDPYSNL